MRSKFSRLALNGLTVSRQRPASALGRSRIGLASSRNLSSTCALREYERKWSTPLAKQLTDAINITGPIPLASYMRMCLTSDVGGYYTGALEEGRDQFGRKGDFITSPEISQVFGELVGIWFVAEWMSQGRPKQGVDLIEVGPGRGTLMDDMLRTMRNFKDMSSSISTVYMVEASKELREQQKNLLCGKSAPMEQTAEGWRSTSKYSNIPIVWTETIRGLPQSGEKIPFIVAHEFFDALPIHAFQVVEVPPAPKDISPQEHKQNAPTPSRNPSEPSASTTGPTLEWREMVVSPTPAGTTHADLATPKSEQHGPVPEFQMTLSPESTRHSRYLPESSPRYRALKSTPGSLIEVCPDASLYATEFATRIGGKYPPAPATSAAAAGAARKQQQQQQQQQIPPSPRQTKPLGAALILDYGPADTIPTNSLRGIRRHARVGPFQEPGLVDLSADVDFAGVAEVALSASPGVEVHGPVDQAFFLESMGIVARAEMLVGKLKSRIAASSPASSPSSPSSPSFSRSSSSSSTDNGAEAAAAAAAAVTGEDVKALQAKIDEIERACKRLVDRGPGGMGKLYKVLAIVPENGGRRRPVGFGGDLA